MKKLLLRRCSPPPAPSLAKKKIDEGKHEQALWAEATDNVDSGLSHADRRPHGRTTGGLGAIGSAPALQAGG